MATISENLEALKTAKINLKSAIEGKGQDLTNVPFTEYSEKIASIQSKEDLDAELTEQDALLDELDGKIDDLPNKDVDLSQTTATVEDVLQGKKFYNAQGEFVEGSYVSVSKLGQVISGDAITLTTSDLAGATQIRERAFSNYPGEYSITIPSSVSIIQASAFQQSYYLKNVSFEENSQLNTIGNKAFYYCVRLSGNITLPASVINLGDQVFWECEELLGITFEDGSHLNSIPVGAFGVCYKLENIIIPPSVTAIFRQAFYNCNKLTEITILSQTPPSLENTNAISTATTTIYIPAGTLSAYESATNWSAFAGKFVELEG